MGDNFILTLCLLCLYVNKLKIVVMEKRIYLMPYIELCAGIVVVQGFSLSNMESIGDEEYPEIEW